MMGNTKVDVNAQFINPDIKRYNEMYHLYRNVYLHTSIAESFLL